MQCQLLVAGVLFAGEDSLDFLLHFLASLVTLRATHTGSAGATLEAALGRAALESTLRRTTLTTTTLRRSTLEATLAALRRSTLESAALTSLRGTALEATATALALRTALRAALANDLLNLLNLVFGQFKLFLNVRLHKEGRAAGSSHHGAAHHAGSAGAAGATLEAALGRSTLKSALRRSALEPTLSTGRRLLRATLSEGKDRGRGQR